MVPLSLLVTSFGKQMGRTKSVISTGSSSLTKATILPSTGDRTIPTIRRSCCHGVVLCIRIVPNLAVHSAFGCPYKRNKKQSNGSKTRALRLPYSVGRHNILYVCVSICLLIYTFIKTKFNKFN